MKLIKKNRTPPGFADQLPAPPLALPPSPALPGGVHHAPREGAEGQGVLQLLLAAGV